MGDGSICFDEIKCMKDLIVKSELIEEELINSDEVT
jgi:hypothetical protein